jgi:hypothetical protein
MNGPETITNAAVNPALLDRVVDGEVGEAERASLLRALDREPDGWKRCALAFLEAQAWREEAADGAMDVGLKLSERASRTSRPFLLRRLIGVAAMVAVGFCVGFVSRDAVSPGAGSQPTVPIARELTPSGAAASSAATQVARAESALPPAVRELLRLQMERQGYRVEGDRRVVPVALGDGRKVEVPIDTVSVKYVGQRVY